MEIDARGLHFSLIYRVNDIRSGIYLFNDATCFRLGSEPAKCVTSVMVTVVSTTVPGRAIVDGGLRVSVEGEV
jgi:D-serine deaminase-like pyridoxal phosphate-dependent protein